MNRLFLVRSENEFCFRFATRTFTKLQQARGNSFLSRVQVFRWFEAFLEVESRRGRTSTATTDGIVQNPGLARFDRQNNRGTEDGFKKYF